MLCTAHTTTWACTGAALTPLCTRDMYTLGTAWHEHTPCMCRMKQVLHTRQAACCRSVSQLHQTGSVGQSASAASQPTSQSVKVPHTMNGAVLSTERTTDQPANAAASSKSRAQITTATTSTPRPFTPSPPHLPSTPPTMHRQYNSQPRNNTPTRARMCAAASPIDRPAQAGRGATADGPSRHPSCCRTLHSATRWSLSCCCPTSCRLPALGRCSRKGHSSAAAAAATAGRPPTVRWLRLSCLLPVLLVGCGPGACGGC